MSSHASAEAALKRCFSFAIAKATTSTRRLLVGGSNSHSTNSPASTSPPPSTSTWMKRWASSVSEIVSTVMPRSLRTATKNSSLSSSPLPSVSYRANSPVNPCSATACAAASRNFVRISSSQTAMWFVPENREMSSAQSASARAAAACPLKPSSSTRTFAIRMCICW